MRMRNLPSAAVVALEKAFKKARNGREKIRFQALKLLTQGYTREESAKITGASIHTLGRWVTNYNKNGLLGLTEKPQPGNHHKLTKQDKLKIKKLLHNNAPDQLGYEGKFWNIKLLRRLIKDKFGLEYKSKESYRKLLHFAGFSFHKPKGVNKKRNGHMVKRFEDKLKKDSGDTREKIVWYW